VTQISPAAAILLDWARGLGIQVGVPGPTTQPAVDRPDLDSRPASADDLVRALRVKGSASLEALASAVEAAGSSVQAAVDELIRDGLVERAGGALRLTATGRRRGRELIAEDRSRWGEAGAMAALERFQELDKRMKKTVTDWQLKSGDGDQVVNDHGDPAYDLRVLTELGALHDDTSAWLTSLSDAPARFGPYQNRLSRALDRAREGDQRYVASPMVDSYHGVWFELHEDLIQLAGRTRAEEAAAGRA
jgi:pyruvate,orthophosphate dikinase